MLWLSSFAVVLCMLLTLLIGGYVAYEGTRAFWPGPLVAAEVQLYEDEDPLPILGEVMREETLHGDAIEMWEIPEDQSRQLLLILTGNRELAGTDFDWYPLSKFKGMSYPPAATLVERLTWGRALGFPIAVINRATGERVDYGTDFDAAYQRMHDQASDLRERANELRKGVFVDLGRQFEELQSQERKGALTAAEKQQQVSLNAEYERLLRQLTSLENEMERYRFLLLTSDAEVLDIPLAEIVRQYRPNELSLAGKLGVFFDRLGEFLTEEPREANTEGGVFPQLFGTVVMVLVMSVLVTPIGVITATYLSEYAAENNLTRAVRVCINNLAGVPSIVYGMFGFGLFVYVLGGNIDQLFYADALPQPTFGSPGLLWASLTLALMTLPVVIVSTEEGLKRLPRELREGAFALGATKYEVIRHLVWPTAAPAMLTGLVLAVARAAGEVAPLMLVGAVKLAPALPIDGEFPYLHLERKFMHLGFAIYDLAFQSPNVDASRPLVFATALLLLLTIVALNLAAILVRNRLRERVRALETGV